MKLLLTILLSAFCFLLSGQFVEPKFGKIEISDLMMNKYDKDTTADALFLFDNGSSRFVLNSDKEFQYIYERHYRIKIFKTSAFYLADVNFKLYQTNTAKERLLSMKAATYNLVKGKVVQTKLENDQIFQTDGENYVNRSFAFPEVKEGSIIELSYTISSDFLYDFRGWKFQYSCPALWSQYSFVIPEYFSYRTSSKGYLQYDKNENTSGAVTFSLHHSGQNTIGREPTRTAAETQLITASTKETVLGVKDVPAFISEPNIDCEDNYKQSIEFELISIQLPNSGRKDYTQTWESVNARMTEDKDFGMHLGSGGFVKDIVTDLCVNKTSEIEKAQSIYNYLQKRMKWNGKYSLWAFKGLKKPFEDQTGSSSEINLLLTTMLQTAGLKASPVIFSTRDNGFADAFYPTISKFNSVLTSVEIEGKVILLDAISKYCPFGVLPANDLNGKGRIVNSSYGGWVNLTSSSKHNEAKSYVLNIDPDGKFIGSVTGNYDGYAGIGYRNNLDTEKTTDDYIRKIQENLKGLTINKYFISDRNNNSNPVSDTFNVEITDHAEMIGDKIMFNPLLFEKSERNRYTLQERKYPVDYNYPISETYTFDYTIPEGYIIESLPESVSLKLPDNSISVYYNIKSIDNKIRFEYRREVNRILFLPTEYAELKTLYDRIVKKHAEQVILKKTA